MGPPGRKSIDKARTGIFQGMSDLQSIGKTEVLIKDVCTEAGYAGPDNKAFREAIKELVSEELLTKLKGGMVQVTQKAVDEGHMPKPKPPATNEDIQNQFWEKLTSKSAANAKIKGGFPKLDKLRLIYDCILDGNSHTKKHLCCEIGGYAGVDNKGFRNLMTRMKELGMIEIAGGNVTATSVLFPRGRPDDSGKTGNDVDVTQDGDSGSPQTTKVASPTKKRKHESVSSSDEDDGDDDDSSYEG